MKSVCSKCGTIFRKRCHNCTPQPLRGTTAERGYDHAWRLLSERKRAVDPLCERCLDYGKVTPAEHVHHIKPIRTHPELRLDWDNLMSVCEECHRMLDYDGRQG